MFFSPVFTWIDPANRTKLSNTAAAGVYVGHVESSGAYLVLDTANDKVYHRGRAIIVEDKAVLGRLNSGVGLTDMTELTFVDHFTVCPTPFIKFRPVDAVRVEQKLTILSHHAWYNQEDHECVAVVNVSCHQYPAGVG